MLSYLRRLVLPPHKVTSYFQQRKQSSEFSPPTFGKVEVPEQAPLVSGYLTKGFVVRNNLVLGSIALLPRGIYNWKVRTLQDVTPESFTLFHLIEPRIELLVLGTGSRVEQVDLSIIQYLKRKGISLEVQDTPNACATFNILLDEGRPSGAALIPPSHIPP